MVRELCISVTRVNRRGPTRRMRPDFDQWQMVGGEASSGDLYGMAAARVVLSE